MCTRYTLKIFKNTKERRMDLKPSTKSPTNALSTLIGMNLKQLFLHQYPNQNKWYSNYGKQKPSINTIEGITLKAERAGNVTKALIGESVLSWTSGTRTQVMSSLEMDMRAGNASVGFVVPETQSWKNFGNRRVTCSLFWLQSNLTRISFSYFLNLSTITSWEY